MAVTTTDSKPGVGKDEVAPLLVKRDIAAATGMRETSIDFVLHVVTDCGGPCGGIAHQVGRISAGAQAQVAEAVIKLDELKVSILLGDGQLGVVIRAL